MINYHNAISSTMKNIRRDIEITDLLMVYGTLRKSSHNHTHFLKYAEYIDIRHINGFIMWTENGGTIPFVGTGQQNESIIVEIYRVTAEIMLNLDHLEGHPEFYKRTLITNNNEKYWMYMIPDTKKLECFKSYVCTLIPNGDYLRIPNNLT